MTITVHGFDDSEIEVRTIEINGIHYKVNRRSAISNVFYKVHFCGVRRDENGSICSDSRGTQFYICPEAYWNNEFPQPDDEEDIKEWNALISKPPSLGR